MTLLKSACAITLIIASASLAEAGAAPSCSKIFERKPRRVVADLPAAVAMGAATIHRYVDPRVTPSNIAITAWVPIPDARQTGTLVNLNKARLPQELPKRFVIGDGTITRTLVGVDLSAGSPLNQRLEQMKRDFKKQYTNATAEDAIDFIGFRLRNDYMNGAKDLITWDAAINATDRTGAFGAAAGDAVFNYPRPGGVDLPVTPLESYVDVKAGYCLQMAMLGSLFLGKMGIEHRLVNGAVSTWIGEASGHAWIELKDGRIVDPTWRYVGLPGLGGHDTFKDWIFVKNTYRYEDQNYLILALPDRTRTSRATGAAANP